MVQYDWCNDMNPLLLLVTDYISIISSGTNSGMVSWYYLANLSGSVYDVYGENSSPFVHAAQSLRLTFQTDTQFNKTDKKT